LEHEVLDAGDIRKRYPQFTLPDDYSAVWQPDGGFLQPELANVLHLKLARAADADVLTNTPVLGVEPTPRGIRIVLEDRVIDAASAVIAAGPWIGELVPELKPHLTLSRQVLCWFAPRDPDAVRLGTLPVFIIDGEDDIAYGFPDFSGSGFKCASHHDSGTWAQADEARQDAGPADEKRMRDFLDAYLPAAAGLLRDMRTCIYTKTPDEDFVIDLSPRDPRIVVASPCSGHGYKFASVVGEVLADLATEGWTRHNINRFGIDRFAG
jgi:sarcosine oxidase